jgi:hypothetical protein
MDEVKPSEPSTVEEKVEPELKLREPELPNMTDALQSIPELKILEPVATKAVTAFEPVASKAVSELETRLAALEAATESRVSAIVDSNPALKVGVQELEKKLEGKSCSWSLFGWLFSLTMKRVPKTDSVKA